MRHLKAALFIIAVCAIACAQKPVLTVWPQPSLAKVAVERSAMQQIESLATLTRTTRKEQAGCVTDYGILPTKQHGVVIGIVSVGPANPHYFSDSLNVYLPDSSERLCKAGQPTLHTHWIQNEVWGQPSPFDIEKAVERAVPFEVVVSVGRKPPAKVTVYGLR